MYICRILIELKNGVEIKMNVSNDDANTIKDFCESKGWSYFLLETRKVTTHEQVEKMIDKIEKLDQ